MPKYLLTYDLEETEPSPHRVFVEEALKQRWTYVYRTKDDVRRLPATTLWTRKTSKESAAASLKTVIAAANARLKNSLVVEKYIIAHFGSTVSHSNEKKPPLRVWTAAKKLETCILHQKNDPFFTY